MQEQAMPDADSELVGRCAAGDMAALEVLYRRHAERVWRYAWFRTHSREAAAEVVQETFLRIARSGGRFEGRSAFSTWLFAVTRSVAIDHARREQRHRSVATEPKLLRLVPSSELGRPAVRMSSDEARQAVRKAVAALPPAHRDAIVLCELSGLQIREAAEVLGWGESRVKTTLFRARRKLRDLLKPYVADERAKRSG
jgi:RNA polymerase sigma-70 factor (ECF subfamily)